MEEMNIKETFKHKDFTKYARKMTKLHFIANIREAGKVSMLAKCNCCDFPGVLIDGIKNKPRKEGATIAPRTLL